MRHLKAFALVISTLCCIALGAALPYLTLRAQEANAGAFWQKADLSAVSLTLRRKGDVGPVFALLAGEYTETLWEGETELQPGDASRAVLDVTDALAQSGLLPEGAFSTQGICLEPHLLVGRDGSSALLWMCTWDDYPNIFITLDDSTGKAVRILAGVCPGTDETDEDMLMEKWYAFFEEYYGPEVLEEYPTRFYIEMDTVFFNYL